MHFKSNCEGSHRISFAWRSEHKFRDPLLRTKSNFPFVRSLGKGSGVQSPPQTYPAATISSALSSRSPGIARPVTRTVQIQSLRDKEGLSAGASGGGGLRAGNATSVWGVMVVAIVSSFKGKQKKNHSRCLLRNDGFFFLAPRGPFVRPNRPIQVTRCRQRWK